MKKRIRKFRAWSIPDKKYMLISYMPILFNESDDTIIELYDSDTDTFVQRYFNKDIACIDESTMLTGKNGKEIFEGDIVTYTLGRYNFTNIVAYSKYFALYLLLDNMGKCVDTTFDKLFDYINANGIEVVGNKFENKDFLGE